MIRDIVFEQHYLNKANDHLNSAFYQGYNQGVAEMLKVVEHFNEEKMDITPELALGFLQRKKLEALKSKPTPENKCGEIELPNVQTCSLPSPNENVKKPKVEIVK